MKTQYHNRIKQVIDNVDNELSHFAAIDRMIDNFEAMFGVCRLSNNLIRLRNERYNLISELSYKVMKLKHRLG